MIFVHSQREQVDHSFAFIGTFSKVVTIAYKSFTTENGEVKTLKVRTCNPNDYKGEQLPL